MVTGEEFDFMMDCWERVHKGKATLEEITNAIRIAERIIYNDEPCPKKLNEIQRRTVLVDLRSAKQSKVKNS